MKTIISLVVAFSCVFNSIFAEELTISDGQTKIVINYGNALREAMSGKGSLANLLGELISRRENTLKELDAKIAEIERADLEFSLSIKKLNIDLEWIGSNAKGSLDEKRIQDIFQNVRRLSDYMKDRISSTSSQIAVIQNEKYRIANENAILDAIMKSAKK